LFEVTTVPEKKPIIDEQSEHSAPIDLYDPEEEHVSLPVEDKAEQEAEQEQEEEIIVEEEEEQPQNEEMVKS